MGTIYKVVIIVMALYGIWINLTECKTINDEEGYVGIDHTSLEENGFEDSHESKQQLGSQAQGAAVGAGVVGTGVLATTLALCLPHPG